MLYSVAVLSWTDTNSAVRVFTSNVYALDNTCYKTLLFCYHGRGPIPLA